MIELLVIGTIVGLGMIGGVSILGGAFTAKRQALGEAIGRQQATVFEASLGDDQPE